MGSLIIGVLAALASAFSWATSTILIRIGLRNKHPVTVNLFRLYVVSLLFGILFLLTGDFSRIESLSAELILVAFASAVFGFVVGDYFYFHALKMMGVSRTVPITSTYPLWAILWAVVFLKRHVGINVLVGAVLVVAAIVVVRRAEERENFNPRGFIYALIAPLSWSFAILGMDWLTASIPVFVLAGLRMMCAAVGVSVFLPKYASELRQITAREAAVLTGAAVTGLMVGQYLFVYSVNAVGSQIAAPVSAINPIIASSLAILVLREPPNRRILEGLVLAVLGVILISLA